MHLHTAPLHATYCYSCSKSPTSPAASERVFSLLSNCFSKRQDSSLSDYVEASNVINGDSVSVLLHVFGYNIENNSGIIGTKLWE